MIITKTPFRVSFFGGGTDYPAWYRREGGAALSATIDKYCHISCRVLPPFFNLKHRIVWSHIETVQSISEILHPAVREGLRYLGFDDSVGLEIHHQGDLPARSGMGSSSAFAVGLIKALKAMRGEIVGKHDLARMAIELEQDWLRDNVGSQDQVASAHGGFNTIYFERSGEIRVEPVTITEERRGELESHLMLVYTGSGRMGSEVAGKTIANLDQRAGELRQMRAMVDEGLSILADGRPIEAFGELMHRYWRLKRELSGEVSNARIDGIYQTAMDHGAMGGKLLGAGSAGFMVFFAPPERHGEIAKALPDCLRVPFGFEHEGAALIYYKPVKEFHANPVRSMS